MFQRVTGPNAALRLEKPKVELPADTIEFRAGDGALMLTGADRVAPGQKAPERGFRLDGGAVKLEHGADLYGHSGFTLMIDFCRETAADAGYLISFEGSFSLSIEHGTLVGAVVTNRGGRTVRGALCADAVGRWQRAALTFCGRAGRVDLYLDGRRLSAVSDLAGAEQAGNFFADLCIGHRHGGNFTGLLDNFSFLDQPLRCEALPPL